MFDWAGEPIHFGLTRTADASTQILTTQLAKDHLRVDHSSEDTYIDSLVKAARLKFEADTNRILINETWTLTLDSAPVSRAQQGAYPFGRSPIVLPVGPVSSITSITTYDTSDTPTTLSTSVYRLDSSSLPARVVLKDGQSWPTGLRPPSGIVIVFVAGYGAAASDVSDTNAIHAIKLLISHWYANRESVVIGAVSREIEMGYENLIAPLRVPSWA